MQREIVLPETKPALEWVNGRALQKVSPQRTHARAQTRFAAALDAWALSTGLGEVGTEWRFQIEPPGEVRRPLVPDVAFLSYERMPYEVQQETEVPRIAPDVAIEILSPDDRASDIAEKVRVYLAAGTLAVVVVDPRGRRVTILRSGGHEEFRESDAFSLPTELPGFHIPVNQLFTAPQPKRFGDRS